MFAGVDVVHEFHIAEGKIADDSVSDPEVRVSLTTQYFFCEVEVSNYNCFT